MGSTNDAAAAYLTNNAILPKKPLPLADRIFADLVELRFESVNSLSDSEALLRMSMSAEDFARLKLRNIEIDDFLLHKLHRYHLGSTTIEQVDGKIYFALNVSDNWRMDYNSHAALDAVGIYVPAPTPPVPMPTIPSPPLAMPADLYDEYVKMKAELRKAANGRRSIFRLFSSDKS